MKKGLLLTLAFIACLNMGAKSFADGIDPELEIFEDPAYVKKYYDTLVKVNNIDTSFKFKQPALNGVLLGLYGNVDKTYMVVTKDKIFISGVENTSNYIGLNPDEKNCEILKDEINYTLIRCPSYNKFVFFEFENSEKDGSGYTCNKMKEFDTPVFDKENFDKSCDKYASYEIE